MRTSLYRKWMPLLLTGLSLFSASWSIAGQPWQPWQTECSALPKNQTIDEAVTISDATVKQYYEAGFALIAPTLNGLQKPDMCAYEWAEQLKAMVVRHRPSQQDLTIWQAENLKLFQTFLTSTKNPQGKYVFIDRSYVFFNKLNEINKLVAFQLFPNEYLSFAPSDDQLTSQGIATVAANESLLRANYNQVGYASAGDLILAIKKSTAKSKMLLSLVSEHLVVTVRKPEKIRRRIVLMEMQNSRVTSDQDNSLIDPVEANLTRQDIAKYTQSSDRYKPKYGEARPEFNFQPLKFESWAKGYGEDMWIIKEEVLKTRATYTAFDSVGTMGSRKSQGLERQISIPWANRELMVPDLIVEAEAGNFKVGDAPKRLHLKDPGVGGPYFEVQIWGPVRLSDIAAFAFSKTPPDPALLRELRSRGIEVWDARNEPAAVPYLEGK